MKSGAILLWGLESDPPLAAVREHLEALGAEILFADQRDVLETQIDLEVGDCVSACISLRGEAFDLACVEGVYLRPYSSCDLAHIVAAGPGSEAWEHAALVDDMIASWTGVCDALIVNPFPAMAVNNSKPYQLEQIRRQGWSVPETLVTSDPEAARGFRELHGDVIYKSVSGIRSQVSRLGPRHEDRFADIGSCPTQFQRYIRGCDYRVHVVGDEVFPSEVVCAADDYRYPGENDVEIRGCLLPGEIEERCRVTAREADLPFTGIDLRRTAEDEWFCFELNASPGFTYYEARTGQPVANALARLLMQGSARV